MKKESAFLLLSLLLVEINGFGPAMGPYDVEVKQIEFCADEGTGQIHFENNKIRSAGNGKYLFSSPFTFGVPLDEKFKAYIDVQQWGNGGYKPRSIEYTAKGCKEAWKVVGSFLKSLMASTDQPVQSCPIPKGNYTAKDWEITLKFDNVPTLPFNKYRLIMTLYYNDKKVGCEIIYIDVVPKKSPFG